MVIITLQIKGVKKTPAFYDSDKTKAQPLGSQLKQWNLLDKGVMVSFYRNRQSHIAMYYSMDGDLAYCSNIQELMEELQLEHFSEQRMLFVDSSRVNLKPLLVRNGNKFPSIPLAHAGHMKECKEPSYFATKIGYKEHQWNVCADLKVIAMLNGLQGRYTKFYCF